MLDNCDPESGFCTPGDLSGKSELSEKAGNGAELVYIGDPMCSWCYGFAPILKAFRNDLATKGIGFKLVLGGLRPGGGDPWTDQFKDFLRHHWETIEAKTGQPFSHELLTWPSFNYDTEPACRAVVLSRKWLQGRDIEFYDAVQKAFYAHSKDPTKVEFYKPICEEFHIPFDEFAALFEVDFIKIQTREEFITSREWGIQGYPSLLLKKGDQFRLLSNGYLELDQLNQQFEIYHSFWQK